MTSPDGTTFSVHTSASDSLLFDVATFAERVEPVDIGGASGWVVTDELEEDTATAVTWSPESSRMVIIRSTASQAAVVDAAALLLQPVSQDKWTAVFPGDEDGILHSYDENGDPTGELATGAELAIINTMDPTTGVLAGASQIGGVVVINPATGEVEQLPKRARVANLGFARDGQLLVITGFDGTVRVWDLERNTPAPDPATRLASRSEELRMRQGPRRGLPWPRRSACGRDRRWRP